MERRIQARRWRVGTGDGTDPQALEDLQGRRDKHERVTRGKPVKTFGEVLKARQRQDSGEDEPEEEEAAEAEPGAIDPLLGLNPNQSSALSNRPAGKRSGRVIVRG